MKKLFLLFLTVISLTVCASAQTRTVTGTVYDAENSEVLTGVSVTAGQGYGAVTDIDGNFSLRVPESVKAITVSYVGFETQEVKIPASGKVSVYLQPSSEMLDEVIAVAYGESKRSAFTGSAAVVGSAQIEKSQSANVLDALSGRVAGLQLSNASGAPGSGNPTIRIRGFSSINASNAPLYIVDGAPYSGDIDTLNPADIETMTVLKDAASNALYGARGANGVILITTKRAKLGEAQVSVDARWGANTRATQDYDYITDPGQYYEAYYGALYAMATAPADSKAENPAWNGLGLNAAEANLWVNNHMIVDNTYGLGYNVFTIPEGQLLIGINGKLNPNATLGRLATTKAGTFYLTPDNWLDETYRTSLRQEYNMNVSQGTEKSNFFASVNYMKNEGNIIAKADYQRLTARVNADIQAKSWLKVGVQANYTHYSLNAMDEEGASNSTGNIFAAATEIAPIYPLYMRDANGNIMRDDNGIVRYDYGSGDNAGLIRPIFGDSNAISQAILDTNSSEGNNFGGTGTIEIRFLKDFKFTSQNSFNLRDSRSTSITNPFYGSYAEMKGMVGKSHTRVVEQNYQLLLNWSHTFNQLHNAAALVGHEFNKQNGYALSANKNNMFDPDNGELDNAIIEGSSSSYTSSYNNEGWFLRVQYDYDNRIFANASYRLDASSKFHPDHRWGSFWSAGAAWMISKEEFLQPYTWIDVLKIKASYGVQGNDGIGSYLYANQYSLVNQGGSPAAVPTTMGNEDISWEKGGNFNAGVEFAFFKNRLSGDINGYWRKTTDMLQWFTLPPSFGFGGYYTNIGNMENAGLEIQLSGVAIQTRDFTWTVNANLTYQRNRVTYLPEQNKIDQVYSPDFKSDNTGKGYPGYSSGNYFYGEGLSAYTYYTKKFAGVDPTTGQSIYWKNILYTEDDKNNGLCTEDQIGKPTGKMEKTTSYSEATDYAVGDCIAPVFGGISTQFEYKGFDLSVNCNYQIGGKVYDSGYARLMGSPYESSGKGDNIHADQLKAWTVNNTTSDIPRFYFGDQYTNGSSDRFLTNASYFSIEQINFGYTLPNSIARKMYLNKLRVYFACDNVWVWSKRQGLDPRQSFTGGNNNTYYGAVRAISGGLSVTF